MTSCLYKSVQQMAASGHATLIQTEIIINNIQKIFSIAQRGKRRNLRMNDRWMEEGSLYRDEDVTEVPVVELQSRDRLMLSK